MEINSVFSREEAFHLENIFNLLLAAHLYKQVSISNFLVRFWSVTRAAKTFSIKKGENLAGNISKDSMTMNPVKSAALFSESDSN